MNRSDWDETHRASVFVTYWYLWILGGALLTWGLIVALQPTARQKETEANRASLQYVNSAQENMNSALRTYDNVTVDIAKLKADDPVGNAQLIQGMEAQRLNAHSQMCDAATKIDKQYVPGPVQQHMDRVPCR